MRLAQQIRDLDRKGWSLGMIGTYLDVPVHVVRRVLNVPYGTQRLVTQRA